MNSNPTTSPNTLATVNGLIQLVRPKQWVKNVFVLAPLVFAGLFTDPDSVINSLIACLLFCIGSSATYVLNDLRDVESDRKHAVKSKTRPIAAGHVSTTQAVVLLIILYALLIAGYFVSSKVVGVIAIYLVINLLYSLYLKHQPVIDIFCIALGFVLRVYAGAVALSVPVSTWMFTTTLCLALYLASVKRRQELVLSGTSARKVLKSYSLSLVDRYAQISATGALLFYSLFVMTTKPELIITIPFVIFGIFRYWFLVESHELGESPTDALFSDWQLILVILFWIGACAWSILPEAA